MIVKLPMPPSSNKYLMPANNRLIKTSDARFYDGLINIEKIRQHKILKEINDKFKDKIMQVDMYFVFDKKRIIGKKDQIKSIDVSNRVKIAQDAFSDCINIDDKYFKSHFIQLVVCDNSSEEGVYFVCKETKILTLDELKNELRS